MLTIIVTRSGSSMCSVNSHCDTNGEVCMQCYQLVWQ